VLSSAVDRGDKDRIAACHADESHDDHGSFKGSGAEFAEFMSAQPMTVHRQSVFDVEGDEAFFTFHAVIGNDAHSASGRYVDDFQRVGPNLKLGYRRVVPDRTMASDDIANYWQARRGLDDPRYDRRR
jgi:hypothetical protein